MGILGGDDKRVFGECVGDSIVWGKQRSKDRRKGVD